MGTILPEGDRALVEACINKDPKSWPLLITKYSRLVEIAACVRLKKYGFTLPKHDIEDIRQDVFESIWSKNKLKNVAGLDDISYWLATVSGNMAIDHVRNSSNKHSLKAISIDEKFKERCLAELLPSRPLRSECDTAETELAKNIDFALEGLPCRERLIIELHLIHGKKYDEIAELMDLPKGTVSSYAKRAKEKLKAALKDFLIFFAIISGLLTSLYIGGFHD